MGGASSTATVVIDRLLDATNRHDLEGIAGCFAPDFENRTPLHPARSFRGREQVRRNWEQILTGVPDLRATIVRRAVDGDSVWTEWEMAGTRRDGAHHLMRGVMVFGIARDVIAEVSFYLEPVDESSLGIDAVIQRAYSS